MQTIGRNRLSIAVAGALLVISPQLMARTMPEGASAASVSPDHYHEVKPIAANRRAEEAREARKAVKPAKRSAQDGATAPTGAATSNGSAARP